MKSNKQIVEIILLNIKADLDAVAKLHSRIGLAIEDVEFYNSEKQDD